MHCENFSAELSPAAAVLALAFGVPVPAVTTDGSFCSEQPANPTASRRAIAARCCFFVLVDMLKVLRAGRSHHGHRRRPAPHPLSFPSARFHRPGTAP